MNILLIVVSILFVIQVLTNVVLIRVIRKLIKGFKLRNVNFNEIMEQIKNEHI